MLKLKSISSSQVNLKSWHPPNEEVFVCLDMEIGFFDIRQGTNLFYVNLATPGALHEYHNDPVLVENRTIVISEYNYDLVKRTILEILKKCSRDDWNESYQVLLRYFQWEYEDYNKIYPLTS